jgi:transcriptional regulator with XRE-family HTH domain
VDDLRFGSIVRAVRHRRGLRQSDLAQLAGLSQQTVSDLERGRVDSLRVIRKIARALEIRVSLAPEWRGGDFDRLTDSRHAALVEVGIAALRNSGWEATAEFTFNRYGERGAVDILGWQAERRALLIVEVKTSLNNLQELLGKLDRKTRLIPGLVAAQRGWRATSVGTVLLVAEQSGMRRPIARHVATFGSTLPARNLEVRRWIAEPRGSLRVHTQGRAKGSDYALAFREQVAQPLQQAADRPTSRAITAVRGERSKPGRAKALVPRSAVSARDYAV